MRKLLTTGALAVAALGLTATTVAAGPPSAGPTIVDVAVEASDGGTYDMNPDDFDILVNAAVALDLVPALSSNRQLTVFAPTDAAFQAAAGNVAEEDVIPALIELVDGDLDALRSIVLFHVTPGLRDVNSVLPASQLPTLSGERLTKPAGQAVLNTGVSPDGAGIVPGTVYASNGIIHVIDTVLLPGG